MGLSRDCTKWICVSPWQYPAPRVWERFLNKYRWMISVLTLTSSRGREGEPQTDCSLLPFYSGSVTHKEEEQRHFRHWKMDVCGGNHWKHTHTWKQWLRSLVCCVSLLRVSVWVNDKVDLVCRSSTHEDFVSCVNVCVCLPVCSQLCEFMIYRWSVFKRSSQGLFKYHQHYHEQEFEFVVWQLLSFAKMLLRFMIVMLASNENKLS